MDIKQLKRLIREEIQKIHELNTSDEIKQSAAVKTNAADLIKAIDNFKQKASETAKSHVGVKALDDLLEKLKFVAANSDTYIDSPSTPNPAVKRAVFKPTSSSGE